MVTIPQLVLSSNSEASVSHWYISNALAGFWDFGTGALIGAVFLIPLRIKLTPLQLPCYLFGCSVYALLPDFDIVWQILHGYRWEDHHDFKSHYPLVMLPLVMATTGGVCWSIGGWRYAWRGATVAVFCTGWHFVHDSPELWGSGIKWAWPFSEHYWTLSGERHQHGTSTFMSFGWPSAQAKWELTWGTVKLAVTVLLVAPRSRWWWSLWAFVVGGVWLCAAYIWWF